CDFWRNHYNSPICCLLFIPQRSTRSNKIIIYCYILSSLFCVIAALIMMSKYNSAKASYAGSFLLVTILASVLGGINPDGGFGKTIGILLALILLQAMESGFNMIGISNFLTMALWGMTLILFIFLKNQDDKFTRYWARIGLSKKGRHSSRQ
ncbi:hypothetical protein ABTQ23_13015, partial [Celerinatantimonas sp. MCCC 1A17872]